MVGKKKELSGKQLKRATGGAWAAGEGGGSKHGGTKHGPRAGHVTKKPLDAGRTSANPRGGHTRFEHDGGPRPV